MSISEHQPSSPTASVTWYPAPRAARKTGEQRTPAVQNKTEDISQERGSGPGKSGGRCARGRPQRDQTCCRFCPSSVRPGESNRTASGVRSQWEAEPADTCMLWGVSRSRLMRARSGAPERECPSLLRPQGFWGSRCGAEPENSQSKKHPGDTDSVGPRTTRGEPGCSLIGSIFANHEVDPILLA